MAVLHNRVSQAELKKKIVRRNRAPHHHSGLPVFSHCRSKQFRDALYKALHQLNVFGPYLCGGRGINAQISVPDSKVDAFRTYLYSIPRSMAFG